MFQYVTNKQSNNQTNKHIDFCIIVNLDQKTEQIRLKLFECEREKAIFLDKPALLDNIT